MVRRYRNEPEQRCAEELEKRGYLAVKRGWPDFFAQSTDDGSIIAVEVKPNGRHTLKTSQIRVMTALHEAGIRVERYDPEHGFTPFDPKLARQQRARKPRTPRP